MHRHRRETICYAVYANASAWTMASMIGDLDESTMNLLVGMGWTFFRINQYTKCAIHCPLTNFIL
jgi:hypothetical protein